MTNKRDLKKMVKRVCGDLAGECMLAATFIKGIDAAAMIDIVRRIAILQENALSHITFSFDKIPSDYSSKHDYRKAHTAYYKAAYRAFDEKFLAQVQEIVKEMNALLPQEVKDANKKSK